MSDAASTPVAFIGLGNMGAPMAANLRKAGFPVRGYDLSEAARKQAAGDGVDIAESARAALAGARVLVSMLPASRHVESLYLGDDGLLPAVEKDTLSIAVSRITPTTRAHG